MQSRTASSLVASTFRAHGWQTKGENIQTYNRSARYTTHENQKLKEHLVGKYGPNMQAPAPAVFDGELERIVRNQFGDQPWLWKGDVFYAKPFLTTFEDLAIVYVKRYIPDAIASSLDHRTFPYKNLTRAQHEAQLRLFLEMKFDHMVELEEEFGGKVVYTTDVLEGVLDTLRMAIEYAGGEWDEDLFDQAVERRG